MKTTLIKLKEALEEIDKSSDPKATFRKKIEHFSQFKQLCILIALVLAQKEVILKFFMGSFSLFIKAIILRAKIKRAIKSLFSDGKKTIPLYQPPGKIYIVIAKFFLSTKTYEKVMEPSILDMEFEHFEALQHNKIWRARWVQTRFIFIFLRILTFGSIMRSVIDIIKEIPGRS